MRVIFMGTPDFAVRTLEQVIEAGHEVVCVVTQPDKPKGRGKNVQCSPVKECALAHQLPVFQPKRVREADALEKLSQYQADLMVVVAFGQILPKELLELPRFGCINVHASLLPKYRGAAPIQWAVIDGEKESGVTIIRMDEGIDTGDMIARRVVLLREDETGGSLFERLAQAGAELCVEAMQLIADGTAVYEKQDESRATYAKMLTKQLGNINWSESAVTIERLIRGLNPWPSAYTYLNGKTMKIWKATVGENLDGLQPGAIKKLSSGEMAVQTGDGSLRLLEVQLEGKKRMAAADFLRGYEVGPGAVFTQGKQV